MTRSIDVDGLAMRVRVAGLEQRIPGHAVIVFESGGGAPLETWDSVLPAVARFAPLVAYDRAGTGASAWDGLPPSPARVGARLSRLLDRLQVPPPYILVGHSWGGALVRYFAGANPEDVAGILYFDPTDITLAASAAGRATTAPFTSPWMQGTWCTRTTRIWSSMRFADSRNAHSAEELACVGARFP
jgi:pimeloyl-ACP methyl ester carboxylesterase